MEGPHEVGRRPFMPDSTLSRRSAALLRVDLGNSCFTRHINFPRKLQKNPFLARGVYGMFPTIFVPGFGLACFSTFMRTLSKSIPIFCCTLTAPPCPNGTYT